MKRARLALGTWTALLTVALVGLVAMGSALPLPPIPTDARAGAGATAVWIGEMGPAAAVMALARIAAIGLNGYLLAATGWSLVVRLARWRAAKRFADAVTIRWLRRWTDAAVAMSVVAATTAPTAVIVVIVRTTSPAIASAAEAPPPTMRLFPAEDAAVVAPPSRVAESNSRTVVAGDHFWGIAEDRLATAWGREPTDAEIDPYWRTLVANNRHRLVDPGNPDLLLLGQVLNVAPAPEAGG